MAETRLGDVVIIPEVFTENMLLASLELDGFVQSGVMVPDPELSTFLNSATTGIKISPRFMGPLADDEENLSSDDPAVKSSPKKVTGDNTSAIRHSLNQSWSSMDLTATYAGRDPLDVVNTQMAKYWLTRRQTRLLRSLLGVVADNVANHNSDMVVDLTKGLDNTSSDAELAAATMDAESFIDAEQTLGDRMGIVTAVAMHSVVFSNLKKKDLIEFIPQSQITNTISSYTTTGDGNPVPFFRGKRVIVDDGMTHTTANGVNKYYSYLFGAGAIALGTGMPRVPFEIKRDPDSGNGGGQETIFSRVELILHPQGWRYTKDTNPTPADLQAAASWERVWERKRCPIVAMITTG